MFLEGTTIMKKLPLGCLAAFLFFSFCFKAQAKTYVIQLNNHSLLNHLNELHSRNLASEGTFINFAGTSLILSDVLSDLSMIVVDSEDDINHLSQLDEISLIEEDVIFPAPIFTKYTHNNSQRSQFEDKGEITWGLQAIRAPQVWKDNFKGQNVNVLVLDTGIDKNHPDLKDRFVEGKNFLAKTLRDTSRIFNKLLASSPLDPNKAKTNNYDYFDNNGHGTHVSGTIAGTLNNSGVAGVAPEASIYTGRVCGKFSCSAVGLIKGVDWAIKKNIDVINMSLGGTFMPKSVEKAMNLAAQNKIIPVAATGNSGINKIFYPAKFANVIAVGAIDANLKRADFSQYGDGLDIVAPGVDVKSAVPVDTGRASDIKISFANNVWESVKSKSFVGSKLQNNVLEEEMVYVGLGYDKDYTGIIVKDKVALIKRGEITFIDKVKTAMAKGAIGVIIFNHSPGLIDGALTQDGSILPVAVSMIEQTVGEKIQQQLAQQKPVSTQMLSMKTSYASFQGTSMASPHIAGVVALIKQAKPNTDVRQIRDILKRSAINLQQNDPNNEYGAGLANIAEAIKLVK